MDTRSFFLVNGAYMTLLPKKMDDASLKDYWPISLIHSFSKLFSKGLANQVALTSNPWLLQIKAPLLRVATFMTTSLLSRGWLNCCMANSCQSCFPRLTFIGPLIQYPGRSSWRY
uniref:Uncharacterized protein n=1 Tax=Arundo donax TaxID=35708 RepID=A0A0A8YVF9_ARUDO